MASILVEFFRHNLWANLQMLDVCAGLSDDVLDAETPGTYGSIRATLMHLAGAQGRYVEALTGNPPTPTVRESEPFPGFSALRESVQRSSETLIEIAEQSCEDRIVRGIRRGQPFAMPASVFLLQAINHATEHCAQIATILGQHGIEPPGIDAWSFHGAGQSALKE